MSTIRVQKGQTKFTKNILSPLQISIDMLTLTLYDTTVE